MTVVTHPIASGPGGKHEPAPVTADVDKFIADLRAHAEHLAELARKPKDEAKSYTDSDLIALIQCCDDESNPLGLSAHDRNVVLDLASGALVSRMKLAGDDEIERVA